MQSLSIPELGAQDREGLQQALHAAGDARALLLVAHPDRSSRCHPGHGFVADVLHANGFATLPFCLQSLGENATSLQPSGVPQGRQIVRAVLHWLVQQPRLGGRPLALLGLGDAVRPCIFAVARQRPAVVRSLLLLDGRADEVPHQLQRLSLPTLFVLGRCDARRLARLSAVVRDMSAPHRLEMLRWPTKPQPAPGALEAFACMARGWLESTLLHPGTSMRDGAAGPTMAAARAPMSQHNPDPI